MENSLSFSIYQNLTSYIWYFINIFNPYEYIYNKKPKLKLTDIECNYGYYGYFDADGKWINNFENEDPTEKPSLF